MKSKDFTTSMVVEQPPDEVFHAIKNVRRWWSENIEGKTDELMSEFTHRDRYLLATFRIAALTPQRIVWEVATSHCNKFLDHMDEWEGTKIIFEIIETSDQSQVRFTHQGLIPQFECYEVCSKAWDYFIRVSLKSLIETGKGDPISTADASFSTAITVDKTPEEVYADVLHVRRWWLHNLQGTTNKLNGEFKFYAGERLQFHIKVIALVTYKKIIWLVVNQHFQDGDDQEWKDTTMVFDIAEKKGQTRLRFTHLGLVPPLACYNVCQNSWTNYIQISLFNFINNGQGRPNKW